MDVDFGLLHRLFSDYRRMTRLRMGIGASISSFALTFLPLEAWFLLRMLLKTLVFLWLWLGLLLLFHLLILVSLAFLSMDTQISKLELLTTSMLTRDNMLGNLLLQEDVCSNLTLITATLGTFVNHFGAVFADDSAALIACIRL